MSGDLKTQVRDYTEFFMGTVESIDLEEIKERPLRLDEGPVQTLASPSRHRGWLVGVAGAAVVLVLGLLTFLTRQTDSEVPVGSSPSPSPTVTTPDTVPSNSGDLAETVGLIAVALEQEEVHNKYGNEVRAQLEYVSSYLTGMTESGAWPEPTFDTSGLGVESVLTEVDPDPSYFFEGLSSPPSSNSGGIPMNPFLAAAQLEGTTTRAAFTIVLAFKDDIVDVQWRLLSRTGGTQSGELGLPPNIIMFHGGGSAVTPVLIGGLPLETSVITTTLADGTKVWQRPISGIAIFDDPNKQCVGVPENLFCEFEYTVFDAEGDEILRIVSLPNDDSPAMFWVDTP